MLPDRLRRLRKNTASKPFTPAADWLLAGYDATVIGDALDLINARSVAVQPIYTLKSIYEPGDPMRVTASDYGDTGRWWL